MANDAAMASAPDAATADPAKENWVKSVAGQIGYLGTGDRAALRRIPLTRSREADGIVVKLLVRSKLPDERIRHDFDRWRSLAHVAATLSGTGAVQAHDERRSLGRALSDVHYAENRLLRLLAARGDALVDQVHRAARMLATTRKPVNLWTLYHLLGSDPRKADAARIRIAQDFYAAEARSEEGNARDD
ncbi:type I-E CRISPR-associated protein Cse2/CasB [Sphingomonas sp. VNH70]|uniref:type I-E CRISPR-associated protein Cse2/CasB n=1 Tax=Sphingomonas silueang TaxID=3156617 RepID=UPI0032B4DB98